MKKKLKKLTLSKETLRTLVAPELTKALGGSEFTTGCESRIQNCFCPIPTRSSG